MPDNSEALCSALSAGPAALDDPAFAALSSNADGTSSTGSAGNGPAKEDLCTEQLYSLSS